MAPRKKNPAIKSSGTTSSKAAPLPDWVKGGGPKPPPSYTKAGKEAAAAAAAAKNGNANHPSSSSSSSSPSLASKDPNASQSTAPPVKQEREMLFPPGSKTPLNMLYERIQKLPGWEKPLVEPRRHPNGYSCVVTLRKANKQDAMNPFVVRFEPKEPGVRLDCSSSLEAKHWGATYALFRIFNTLPLYRALPPGPREYWQKLEQMKKESASHMDWMWESDPFDAQIKRETEKAKKEKEKAAAAEAVASGSVLAPGSKLNGKGRPLSKAWQEAKEVRMSPSLREMVESTIRRLMTVFPEACSAPLNLEEEDDDEEEDDQLDAGNGEGNGVKGEASQSEAGIVGDAKVKPKNKPKAKLVDVQKLEQDLTSLGFRPGHAKSAAKWCSSARQALADPSSNSRSDPLLASVAALGDKEAAIEYLMLYTPEDDLPQSFKPSKASESFITSSMAGSGGDGGLAVTWAIERLTKYGGYPREAAEKAMKSVISMESSDLLSREAKEALALEVLNRRLAGWQDEEGGWGPDSVLKVASKVAQGLSEEAKAELEGKREDEKMAVEAVLGSERISPVPANEGIQADDFDVLIAGPGTQAGGKEDVRLRVKLHSAGAYPSADLEHQQALPCFHVASSTLPSYLKLALTLHLLRCFNDADQHPDWQEMIAAGEGGILLAMVEELESVWKGIVDDPPLLGDIMKHIVPQKAGKSSSTSTPALTSPDASRPATPNRRNRNDAVRKHRNVIKRDVSVDEKLRSRQKVLHSSQAYAKMGEIRRSLPAHASMEKVLRTIGSNRVIIIAGETGCGKTTQVPQFILDEAISNGRGSECNIVVTQPRRVSAMGVASRVAVERGEELDSKSRGGGVQPDSLVGYAIRGERKASRECRLLFTTTGVLLRRLGAGGDKDLEGISHVIVDEVHERSVDSDFLLLELREVLKRNPKIKVILMSATINQETFSEYFRGAPCIEIPGRTFPVKDHYLEDIIRETRYRPSSSSTWRSGGGGGSGKDQEQQASALRASCEARGLDEACIQSIEQLSRSDRIDYDLLGSTAKWVIERAEGQEKGRVGERVGGALLVFCPGVGEIKQAMDSIKSWVSSYKVDILPLHANLSPEEQRRVFQPAKPGHRKVVVATNVAETSITIPDISYVIDTGKVKETRFEPESGLTRLVECWASRAACRQRRGRAGRVREGECFKLYTRLLEERKMVPQQTPEMKRVPLESLFLEVKNMREDEDVKAYLNKAIDPPSLASMDQALRTLVEVGAIHEDKGFKSRLTSLGKHLATLPLDLKLGKLLILGTVFGCLGPMLTVASIMSCKPLFNAPMEKRDEVNKARSSFSNCNSDLLTDANAFDRYMRMRWDRRSNSEIRQFCETNFLSQSTLREIQTTRLDLLSNLEEMGFVERGSYNAFAPASSSSSSSSVLLPTEPAKSRLDVNSDKEGMLRGLILAGLWPNLVRISLPSAKFDQSSSGTIQRDAEAKAVKYFDREQGRVFLHPSSTLFQTNSFKSSYLAVFKKSASGGVGGKVYLRDATEVPLYSILLLGGKLKVNHFNGGISVGDRAGVGEGGGEGWIKLRANARIGVLCAQLRRLLDASLSEAFERPGDGGLRAAEESEGGMEVVDAMVALMVNDGM